MSQRKNVKFQMSIRAHERLNNRYLRRGNTAENRAFGNYHAHCIELQRESGSILSRKKRTELFDWWCKYEGYSPRKH